MDLTNEFAALQTHVDRKMKIYADQRIDNAIKALCMDNPSLYKSDVYKTMAKYQCTYTDVVTLTPVTKGVPTLRRFVAIVKSITCQLHTKK